MRSCPSSTTICSIPSNRSSFSSSWTFCHAAVAAARCGAMSASALAPIAAAADNVQMLPHTLVRLDDPSVRALVGAEALGIGTPGPGGGCSGPGGPMVDGMCRLATVSGIGCWAEATREDLRPRRRATRRPRRLAQFLRCTSRTRCRGRRAGGLQVALRGRKCVSVSAGPWGGGNRETEIRFLETLESRCSGTIPLRRVLWAGRT